MGVINSVFSSCTVIGITSQPLSEKSQATILQASRTLLSCVPVNSTNKKSSPSLTAPSFALFMIGGKESTSSFESLRIGYFLKSFKILAYSIPFGCIFNISLSEAEFSKPRGINSKTGDSVV